jgi:hypothetical protein
MPRPKPGAADELVEGEHHRPGRDDHQQVDVGDLYPPIVEQPCGSIVIGLE